MNRRRRLRLETLEMRRVLAAFSVTTAADVVDENDSVISLREAISSANGSVGPDSIMFDPVVFGSASEIDLLLGQLDITDSLTISGPEQHALRIDGQGDSRVIGFFSSVGDLTLESLTVTGGRTTLDDVNSSESGGAIRFASGGTLTLNHVTVIENSTVGAGAHGGGIFADPGNVVLNQSSVARNDTSGTGAKGGGIYAGTGTISVVDSAVSGNTTTQTSAKGGGIYSAGDEVSLVRSSVMNNSTLGDLADGGGVFSLAGVTVDSSVISGNVTSGRDADGGGIFANQSLDVTGSDVSFNSTEGRYAGGGGITVDNAEVVIDGSSIAHNQTRGEFSYGAGLFAVRSNVTITGSTISGNTAAGADADGGGISVFVSSLSVNASTITFNSTMARGGGFAFTDNEDNAVLIQNSIVAGNTDALGTPDFEAPPSAQLLTVRSSLIGDNAGTTLEEAQTPDLNGNLVGDSTGDGIIDPMLEALTLAGTTRLHPLLAGSDAVNAGDSSLLPLISADQRGEPFVRIAGSSVDIGSYELQTIDPAAYVVTTATDELDFSNSNVSLREAIITANGNSGTEVISFDPGVFASDQTIELLLGEFVITESMTIEGPGRNVLSIDAAGDSRVMTIAEGNASVVLSGMTITGGLTTAAGAGGGAIQFLADGTLALRDTTVTANRSLGDSAPGGGIYARSGTVTLERSIVTNNSTEGPDASGGGVHSGGALVAVDSTISDNATAGARASGGGIFASSQGVDSIQVTRSTVSGNATTGLDAHGGGIAISDGAIGVTNSTVSQNRASGDGGGIYFAGDDRHQIVSSTIALNVSGAAGGGVSSQADGSSELVIQNSIVATNMDLGSNPDLALSPLAADPLVDASLIGDNSGTNIAESQTPDAFGNIIGAPGGGGVISPMLGRLATRGGVTASHSLLSGSPAIDAGDPLLLGTLDTDQRGLPFVRISDRGPDMGSYETQTISESLFVVNTNVDELDFSNSELSLREALELADGSSGDNTIRFAANVFSDPISIDLVLGELRIHQSVSIDGPGQDLLTIDAQGLSRVLNIEVGSADVTIAGITFTGGRTSGDNQESGGVTETTHSGGGIRFDADGSLTLDKVTITGNHTSGGAAVGGGLFASRGAVTLAGSTISLNSTEGESAAGGGLFVSGSDVSIIDSMVRENSTMGDAAGGGGIAASAATLSILRSEITANSTAGSQSAGGGIESREGDLAIDSTMLDQNSTVSTDSGGGGLLFHDGILIVSDTVVQSNSTSGESSSGGGILASLATITISRSAVVNNSTTGDSSDGAAVLIDGSTSTIINATLSGNSASGSDSSGGGLFSGQGSSVSIVNSTITGNSVAGDGGGVNIAAGADEVLSIANSIVAGNNDSGAAPDLMPPSNPLNLTVMSSLIGDNTGTTLSEAQTADAQGNLIGSASGVGIIDPMLESLAINGGSTPTRAPLAASPVIDAGDDTLAVDSDSNPLSSDGRGAPFSRLFGAVDVGSFEAQPPREAIIDWSDPANLFVGTQLSDIQLSATTDAAGTFTYTPDIGAILDLGDGQELMVQFMPSDTINYAQTTASVFINVVEQSDLGDAPDSYKTLRASDGPRHLAGALRLGSLVDAEVDGQPSSNADGDGSEDDGVTLISSLIADASSSTIGTITVNASSSGMLDAWIDFNGNGVFDHPSEHLGGGTSIKLAARDNIVPVNIPAGATPGEAFARFRISTDGGLLPSGSAADGEVEDHQFTILDGSTAQLVELNLPNGPARLFSDLGNLVVQRRTVDLFRAPDTAVDRFDIVGDEFSNVLTIDTTGGAVIPAGGLSFDGVDRVNTVRLVGPSNSLDLSRDGNVALRNIDVIDMSDPSDSTLNLDARAVRAMDPTGGGVVVVGSPQDSITFVDGSQWRMADPVDVAGFSFSFVTLDDTFIQVDFGSPWQNLAQSSDVNNDGNVTASDALRIINELARRAFSDPDTNVLKDPSDTTPWPNRYYDVSGDGLATALDALRVINQLARLFSSSGVGESESGHALLDEVSETIATPLDSTRSGLPGQLSSIATDAPIRIVGALAAGDVVVRQDVVKRAGGEQVASQASSKHSERSRLATVDQLLADPFFVDDLTLLSD